MIAQVMVIHLHLIGRFKKWQYDSGTVYVLNIILAN